MGGAIITNAVLVGSFRPLHSSPPRSWDSAECLLTVSLDCVVDLPTAFDGKNFSVQMTLLRPKGPTSAEPVSKSTMAKTAGVRSVSQARVLKTNIEDTVRYGEAKERIKFLYKKGCELTPDECAYMLAGLIDADACERIIAEVKREKSEEATLPKGVEILFEQSLRLEIGDPCKCGLRIELYDETVGKNVGVVEWSQLTFLASSPNLEDPLQCYKLDFQGDTRYGNAQIYLSRNLRVVEPVGSAYR